MFSSLGGYVLNNAVAGFNCSMFACKAVDKTVPTCAHLIADGQTGAGKSFTMMGSEGEGADSYLRGLIPRTCDALFQHMQVQPV